MTTSLHTDVAIIGAGPAGVMAAVQLARLRMKALLIEPEAVGGLLHEASLVENFPGFPEGIDGCTLAEHLARHLERFDIAPVREGAEEVRWDGQRFLVRTASRRIEAARLIVAAGTAPRSVLLPVPASAKDRVESSVAALRDRGGERVAVVGGGDAAFDYALQLSRANDILLLHRSVPRGLALLQERARIHPRIRILSDTAVCAIEAEKNGLLLFCERDGAQRREQVNRLLFAIGRVPNDDFLKIGAATSELVSQGRLFFAGDVHNGSRRQAAIAAGEGIMAAMRIAGGEGAWS